MKQIIVTIDKVGRPKVEAVGFAGCGCTEATKGIIGALSSNAKPNDVSVVEKPEIHMIETEDQHESLYN
jgi:hypothetical protein